MLPTPPFLLFCDDRLVGTVISYQYEPPWVSGQLVPRDANEVQRLAAVCELLAWLEATPALCESDEAALYAQGLRERALRDEDVSEYWRGPWTLRAAGGEEVSIDPPCFDRDGVVAWRG